MKKLTLVALLAAAWLSPAFAADITKEEAGAKLPATTIVKVTKDGQVSVLETDVAIQAATAADADAALAAAEKAGAFKMVLNKADPASEFTGNKGSAASWYYYLGYWGGYQYQASYSYNYSYGYNYYPAYNYCGYNYGYQPYGYGYGGGSNYWYNNSYGYGYGGSQYYWYANPYNNPYYKYW